MNVGFGDRIRDTKQFLIATDYLERDGGYNGGGSLLISETCAEIATFDAVLRTFMIIDEKVRRLFKMRFYELCDRFAFDNDPTIILAVIEYIHGPMTMTEYLLSLWERLKTSNGINDKIIDLVICIAHHNINCVHRILRNYKGVNGVSKIEKTKRILLDLRIWQFIEKLKWTQDNTYNYKVLCVVIKMYYFILNTKTIDMNESYSIFFDGSLPWDFDDELEKASADLDTVPDEQKEDSSNDPILRFINQTVINDEAEISINSRFIRCDHCDHIHTADIPDCASKSFHQVHCPNCHKYNAQYIGNSEVMMEIPVIAGDEHSGDTITFIQIRKSIGDNGTVNMKFYIDLAGVQLVSTLQSQSDVVKNPWYTTRQSSSLSNLMLAPMICPFAQSKLYATEERTYNTTAPMELKIKSKKSECKKVPLQEYVSITHKYMMDSLLRYNISLQVPKYQRKKGVKRGTVDNKIDSESGWNRNPGRDKDLADAFDDFMRRFEYKTIKAVIAAINTADIGCEIDANWYYRCMNKLNCKDKRRECVLKFIKRKVHKRLKE